MCYRIVVLLFLLSMSGLGQAPEAMSFQGYLLDASQVPIDGVRDITIELFESAEGGSVFWTRAYDDVEVVDGVFDLVLEGGSPTFRLASFANPLFVQITVAESNGSGPVVLAPRTPLVSSPYALSLRGMRVETFPDEPIEFDAVNVVGGYSGNTVLNDAVGAAISGGGSAETDELNTVTANYGSIGGGYGNVAGLGAVIGGGAFNTASGSSSAVGGGYLNEASGLAATVSGGGANVVSGDWGMVAGGQHNTAAGYAAASGYRAKANHEGSFVWNDRSKTAGTDADNFSTTGVNQFLVRARGGVGINTNMLRATFTVRGPNNPVIGPTIVLTGDVADQTESGRIRFIEGTAANNDRGAYIRYDGSNGTNGNRLHIGVHPVSTGDVLDDRDALTITRSSNPHVGINNTAPGFALHVGTTTSNGNGAHVTDGGAWVAGSSRTFKEDFRPIDPQDVLARVARLPVSRWAYRGSDEGDHLGPMAEDFYEAFGLGRDERYIAGVDADGVALAAIQGLYELVRTQSALLEQQRAELARQQEEIDGLHQALEALR